MKPNPIKLVNANQRDYREDKRANRALYDKARYAIKSDEILQRAKERRESTDEFKERQRRRDARRAKLDAENDPEIKRRNKDRKTMDVIEMALGGKFSDRESILLSLISPCKMGHPEKDRAMRALWVIAFPDKDEREREKKRALREGGVWKAKVKKAKIDPNLRRKERYHSDPEYRKKLLAKDKECKKRNSEAYNERQRRDYEKSKDDRQAKRRVRESAQRAAGTMQKRERKYCAERRALDPTYRLTRNIRSLINKAFKSQSVSKTCSSFKLLGCTGKFYSDYLLNHPTAKRLGFTMENYGTLWHVDHIKPLASFDFESEFQQRQAFNYKNCRPMLATENMSKGSFFIGKRHRHKKAP